MDLIRGIIMIGVTFDHVCKFSYSWELFQFQTAFGKAIESAVGVYVHSTVIKYLYPHVLWPLCFMSGISCQFSRSSVVRLVKVWTVCILFMGGYLALHFILPNIASGYVIFNIIAVLTISVTFWYILKKLKIPGIYRIILGALFTPIGALAGIMWSNILNKHGVKFRYLDFLKIGVIVAIPTLIAALGSLWLMLTLVA